MSSAALQNFFSTVHKIPIQSFTLSTSLDGSVFPIIDETFIYQSKRERNDGIWQYYFLSKDCDEDDIMLYLYVKDDFAYCEINDTYGSFSVYDIVPVKVNSDPWKMLKEFEQHHRKLELL